MAGPAVLTVADTIARSFLLAAKLRGDRPAIREKKFGIWQPTSWVQWLETSRQIAYALHAKGFRPGDVASIVANAVIDGEPIPQREARSYCQVAATAAREFQCLDRVLRPLLVPRAVPEGALDGLGHADEKRVGVRRTVVAQETRRPAL